MVDHNVSEGELTTGRDNAYQVRLDIGILICVPVDTDECIVSANRKMGGLRFAVGTKVKCMFACNFVTHHVVYHHRTGGMDFGQQALWSPKTTPSQVGKQLDVRQHTKSNWTTAV